MPDFFSFNDVPHETMQQPLDSRQGLTPQPRSKWKAGTISGQFLQIFDHGVKNMVSMLTCLRMDRLVKQTDRQTKKHALGYLLLLSFIIK